VLCKRCKLFVDVTRLWKRSGVAELVSMPIFGSRGPAGAIFRHQSSILNFRLAPIFLSRKSRLILRKNLTYQLRVQISVRKKIRRFLAGTKKSCSKDWVYLCCISQGDYMLWFLFALILKFCVICVYYSRIKSFLFFYSNFTAYTTKKTPNYGQKCRECVITLRLWQKNLKLKCYPLLRAATLNRIQILS
jgi:hypothetical protein